MIILAIDPGIHCGWAIGISRDCLCNPALGASGVQWFDLKRGESTEMRWLNFRAWLATMKDQAQSIWNEPIGLIVHKQVHLRGGAAAETLTGFVIKLQEFAAEIGANIQPVHSGTLKKFATGRGNAPKGDMIESAQACFDPRVNDDNEADALWLLEYGR